MYGTYSASLIQKQILTIAHLAAVILAGWVLFGFGAGGEGAGDLRRWVTLCCLVIYFIRVRFTTYLFLKRSMDWNETAIVSVWITVLTVLYAFAGRRSESSLDWSGGMGCLLFIVGSYLNSASEYQRMVWKRRPENEGHLYTGGLFRYSRHMNYFGDVVLFGGLSLIAQSWLTWWIPVAMFLGFVFVNIPELEQYLAGKYPEEWKTYTGTTKKLIPFVY